MKFQYDTKRFKPLADPITYFKDSKSHYMEGTCTNNSAKAELGFLNKKEKDPFYSFTAQYTEKALSGELVRTKSRVSDIISTLVTGLVLGGIAFCIVYFLIPTVNPVKWGIIIGTITAIISMAFMIFMLFQELKSFINLADRFIAKNFNCRRIK